MIQKLRYNNTFIKKNIFEYGLTCTQFAQWLPDHWQIAEVAAQYAKQDKPELEAES
jgi:hypothetical protein